VSLPKLPDRSKCAVGAALEIGDLRPAMFANLTQVGPSTVGESIWMPSQQYAASSCPTAVRIPHRWR